MRVLMTVIFLLLANGVRAAPVAFHGGPQRVALVELYTSEGCSSCPPADRLLSSLARQDPRFEHAVPLAFHVTYWDYIGWRDPFAGTANDQRQRRYSTTGRTRSVYTPQFVVGGREWTGFFHGARQWPATTGKPGVLSARLDGTTLKIHYEGPVPDDARLNWAWFGNGLTSRVARGENGGRTLHHDFVVLAHQAGPLEGKSRTLNLPPPPSRGQARTGLAVWLSDGDRPLQAAATLLPQGAY